jgi:hypothetical protein
MPIKKTSAIAAQLPVPVELIERRIYLIRGQKVMLDSDLAALYQVETRALIQAIKRNPDRFPADFMFQLSKEEADSLRSQSVISNAGRGGRRYSPYAFTEHGALSLSFVLKSKRAIAVSIHIIRTFVKLREMMATHKDLARKIEQIETIQKRHGAQIGDVILAVEKLIRAHRHLPPAIGFKTRR